MLFPSNTRSELKICNSVQFWVIFGVYPITVLVDLLHFQTVVTTLCSKLCAASFLDTFQSASSDKKKNFFNLGNFSREEFFLQHKFTFRRCQFKQTAYYFSTWIILRLLLWDFPFVRMAAAADTHARQILILNAK